MRRVAVLLCAVSLALVGAGTSSAQRVEHITLDNNFTFIGGFISAACGFDVTVTTSGFINVTLFNDENGNVVREIDTSPAGQATFSAHGKSISFSTAGNVLHQDYPGGAFIGSPSILTFSGNYQGTPGVFLSPGVYVFSGTVIDFLPEGVPVATFDVLIESHGNPTSQEENMAAICSAID